MRRSAEAPWSENTCAEKRHGGSASASNHDTVATPPTTVAGTAAPSAGTSDTSIRVMVPSDCASNRNVADDSVYATEASYASALSPVTTAAPRSASSAAAPASALCAWSVACRSPPMASTAASPSITSRTRVSTTLEPVDTSSVTCSALDPHAAATALTYACWYAERNTAASTPNTATNRTSWRTSWTGNTVGGCSTGSTGNATRVTANRRPAAGRICSAPDGSTRTVAAPCAASVHTAWP